MRVFHEQAHAQQTLPQLDSKVYANSSLQAQKSHSLNGTYKMSGPGSSDSSESINERGKEFS